MLAERSAMFWLSWVCFCELMGVFRECVLAWDGGTSRSC